MGAANTFFEVLQLSDQVPVTHALEPWGVRCPCPLPIRTVTGSAGLKSVVTFLRIAGYRGRSRCIRQRLDVSDDVIYGGIICQRRRHRCHHFSENILVVRAPSTELEILQLPSQIPVGLPTQFGRIQRRVTLRLRAMTGSAHCVERLAGCSIAGYLSPGLREGRMAALPRLEGGLLIHDHFAAHGKMCNAT